MAFRRTLRYKLTAWYTLAMAMGLVVIATLVFVLARYHMLRHYDEPLRSKSEAVVAILGERQAGGPLSPWQEAKLNYLGKLIVTRRSVHGEKVIYYSREFRPDSLDLWIRPPSREDFTEPEFQMIKDEGTRYRVYLLPVDMGAGVRGVVRIIEDLSDLQDMLRQLMLDFSGHAVIGILVSFAGGYWIVGRALAPLVSIIQKAKEIEASSLHQRIPDHGLDDETGMLAVTLNRMIERLESSFDAMKRFTADASHELRNPLATVRNTIDVTLERPRTPGEYEAAMQSMGEEVDRIRSIVEDLLFLARADSNRVVMKLVPVGLDRILEAQVEAHQFQAEERNIRLGLQGLIPDEILGDERWLHQVVGNLLDNALKYTPMGGAVSADLRRKEDRIQLRIQDSGPGIPEEDLTRIFERFFRADASRSRAHVQGVGLGLAIAAWVVKEHGGSLEASNRPEGGTTFTVEFPLIQPSRAQAAAGG